MNEKILKSELAGSWYADDPTHLSAELKSYFDAVEPTPVDEVQALILPHAGYRYSGIVAASGIKLIEGKTFSRIMVIGPSHRVAMQNVVSIPDVSHIETPLGKIELDRACIEKLRATPAFESRDYAHAAEHSVQIELPLLQQAVGEFKLVPMVCGQLDETAARFIAATLLKQIDNETLVIVSTDFTHYGAAFDYVPFDDPIKENLKKLDMGAFDQIKAKDLHGFLNYVNKTGITLCGRSPVAVLLALLSESSEVELLKYDTSGNMTGDWHHCVSYLSAVVKGRWRKSASGDRSVSLSHADKIGLLRLARHQMARQFSEDVPDLNLNITPGMKKVMGAFVTLHKNGQLRGCIGEIFPRRPLVEAVEEQAENAAFHDPRFPALRPDEIGEIDIEISALTVPHPVDSYEEIEIGRHGIVLYKGMQSAVFLPQVAPEQGWDRATTLSHLCMKAGLRSEEWKSGCEFHIFEAIVFGEEA